MTTGSSAKLATLNWDFRNAPRDTGTHLFHPYPAKFISQIPSALIGELSQEGDVVLDPFCGSGTALVEAVRFGRHGLGADINPVAVLLSRAKLLSLTPHDQEQVEALLVAIQEAHDFYGGRPHFGANPAEPLIPRDDAIDFWFDEPTRVELGLINAVINRYASWKVSLLAKVALSSILVSVSRQDSDTRYVRRDKNIKPAAIIDRFRSKLRAMVKALLASPASCSNAEVWIGDARNLPLGPSSVDLVVTSPPYPNAYSYHLYHRTRLLWLGFDPSLVKRAEIGSHRHYSARGGADRETFKSHMLDCFYELRRILRPRANASFVIGDSIIRGDLIDNSRVLIEAADAAGLRLTANYKRNMDDRKKSFNPAIGKIKQEHILVFQSP